MKVDGYRRIQLIGLVGIIELALVYGLVQRIQHIDPLQIWEIGKSVASIAYSSDGQLLALGLSGGTVQLRNVSDGSLVLSLAGPPTNEVSVALSSDGELLAAGSGDGKFPLYVWWVGNKNKGKLYTLLGGRQLLRYRSCL